MNKFISLVVFFFVSNYAICCSCIFGSFYQSYNQTEKIFTGKVSSVGPNKDNSGIEIVFKLIKAYKGIGVSDSTIIINTGFGHGDCGLRTEANEVWLIFSSEGRTGICSPNYLLEKNGKAESAYPRGEYTWKNFVKMLDETVSLKSEKVKEYNKNKKLIASGKIVNGVPQGYWEYNYEVNENWPTKDSVFYNNGLQDSIEYEYYKSGKLYSSRSWKNGKLNGRTVCYFESGGVDYDYSYLNGNRHRESIWWYENKQLRMREFYDDGKKVGVDVDYFENGDTSSVSFYDKRGNRTKLIGRWENGNPRWLWTFNYPDDYTCIGNYIDYYENGNIKSNYTNYKKAGEKYKDNGERIIYYENGKIKSKELFEMDKEVGVWEYYDENGVLVKTEKK